MTFVKAFPDRNSCVSSEASDTVLLTGATGFLGGAIAAEILEQPSEVELLFLVRACDPRTGLERLVSSISRFEPSPHALARLNENVIVCGDLASFPAFASDPRTKRITHVLNCAAAVSFAWKREVWTTNVEDTLQFARCVADLPRLRRVLHVSTALVCGAATDCTVHEDEFPGSARQFTLYTKSKAKIERRLPRLLDGALTLVRPSIVLGHTRLGCEASASIFWLFRMIHAARQLPFPPRNCIDIVPVDYCARSLVHLLFNNTLTHSRYHVSAGPQASCSFAEIDAAFSRACGTCGDSDLEEFDIEDLPALESKFQDWFGPCNTKQAARAIRVYHAFAGLNVTFDNRRALRDAVDPPPRLTDYIAACVRTGQRESVAEQMARDFR